MRQKCVDHFCDIYLLKVRKYTPKCHNSSYKSVRYGSCNNIANNKVFVIKVSRLFGYIPDSLEGFQTVQKLSTLSVNFPHCQKTFQTVWKLSRLTGKFPDCRETFQTDWKLSRLPSIFTGCPETFQTVWKLSTLVSHQFS